MVSADCLLALDRAPQTPLPVADARPLRPFAGSSAATVCPEAVRPAYEQLVQEASRWAAVPLAERLQALRRLRGVLADEGEAIAVALAREIGRPMVEGYGGEILPTLRSLRWLEQHAGRVLQPEQLRRNRCQEWEPYGVIGLLSPWNYPLFLSLPIIAAALAAGNVVLWKPSELALESSDRIAQLLIRAGLESQVRVAPGNAEVGEAVVAAGCAKYVLIGSVATGRAVLSRLGEMLRPAVAELSGCDPMVVCADADVSTAAAAAVWSRALGAGQTCMAPKRLYVHQDVYETFLQWVAVRLQRLRIGDPLDPRTEMGPLRTEQHRSDALAAIEDACHHGARLLHGGSALPGPGCYMTPALLAECNGRMRVMREDLQAPVLAVCPVRNDEEAIALANESAYALSASVWTRDLRRGRVLARHLPGGLVSINDVILPGADPNTPFGGSGDSGYGRLRGAAGLREMVRPRITDGGPPPWSPRHHFFPYREGTLAILQAITRWEGSIGRSARSAIPQLARTLLAYRRGARQ